MMGSGDGGGGDMRRKTSLCKFFMSEGRCRYEKTCMFAHSEAELVKPVHAPLDSDVSSGGKRKWDTERGDERDERDRKKYPTEW